ncbi:MAG: hypothetical protein IK079_00170 [Desulfovibrio sp.]|nr:hypothetical protein [Desulfovibrio sp.]
MWLNDLYSTVYLDAAKMTRTGLSCAKSLNYLATTLKTATVISLGASEDFPTLPSRPSFFTTNEESEHKILLPLPQPILLLEYTVSQTPTACLLTDAREVLEVYLFHYDQNKVRWIWPLIGLGYGPSEHDVHQIAVYEATLLTKMPTHAKNSMVQELASSIPTILVALSMARERLPIVQRKPKKNINSAALFQKNRIQHRKGSPLKGSRRS